MSVGKTLAAAVATLALACAALAAPATAQQAITSFETTSSTPRPAAIPTC